MQIHFVKKRKNYITAKQKRKEKGHIGLLIIQSRIIIKNKLIVNRECNLK